MNTDPLIEQTPCIRTQLINDLTKNVNDDVLQLLSEVMDAIKSPESQRLNRMRAQAERRRTDVIFYTRQSPLHQWIQLRSKTTRGARYEIDRMGCGLGMVEIGRNYGNSQPQQILFRRNHWGEWVSVSERIPTRR